MTTKYSHDLQYVTINNYVDEAWSSDFKQLQLPEGSWQTKLKMINEKIDEFKIDESVKWIMLINNKIIDPSDVIMSDISPPVYLPVEFHSSFRKRLTL